MNFATKNSRNRSQEWDIGAAKLRQSDIFAKINPKTANSDHLQGAHPSRWSFARCQILQMIICKRQDHLGDHLQMTGPSRWSFARGQILRMISYKRLVFLDDHLQGAGFSWWSFARGRSIRMIFCKRPVPLDDHLQEAVSTGWSFARGWSSSAVVWRHWNQKVTDSLTHWVTRSPPEYLFCSLS